MSRASRNQRHKMRIKRSNSQLKRALNEATIDKMKLFHVLLLVLAQKGGEVTVTKGTAEQVAGSFQQLGYKIDAGANENEFVVRLVNSADALPEDTIDDIDEQIEEVVEIRTEPLGILGTDTETEPTPPTDHERYTVLKDGRLVVVDYEGNTLAGYDIGSVDHECYLPVDSTPADVTSGASQAD